MKNTILNNNQKKAVSHYKNPMLVLAGPGSGKTTVVVHRIKNLIEEFHVSPHKILVITFTKASAVEMENRFRIIEPAGSGRVTFGTFHSLFFRIIRDAYGYTLNNVLSDDEKWNTIKGIIHELELEVNDEEEYTKEFISELSKMKNELIELKHFNPFQSPKEEFQVIYKKYDSYKTREEKIDFDDMLCECHTILTHDKKILKKWQSKFEFILVDEFQDINKVQYECIKLLAQPENNLFVVGDDDQSIYKFRGARPEFLLSFPNDFDNSGKIVLDINYRSSDNIIKLSNKLVKNNQKRFDKELKGIGREGSISEFFSVEDTGSEAIRVVQKIKALHDKGVDYDCMAVIFRTNMQAGNFTRAFMDSGIAYNLKDNIANLFEHWITKDILAYVSLALDENSNNDFIRILNKPKRYISREIISDLNKSKGSFIHHIFTMASLKPWQSKQITELKQHLAQIRKRKPYEAIKYIRNIIGYDEYLEEYSKYRKGNVLGLKEIADEMTQIAKGLERLEDFIFEIDKLSNEMKESKNTTKKPLENAVTLSTIHSAKGLEFEAVFIPSVIEGIIPHEKSTRPEEIEEERRLFYVGVTRAKTYLCLSEITTRYDKDTKRSRFLIELGLSERKK